MAFQAFLDQACDRAFTWGLRGAAMRIFCGWCSDDSFEYFRLWLIGRGRMTFERAITMPDSLAGMALKPIVAATSPWVRILRPSLLPRKTCLTWAYARAPPG